VVFETQEFGSVAAVDPDFQEVEAVENDKTFALVSLIILLVNPPEFFATKLDGVPATLAQHVKCLFRDIGDQITHVIDPNDGSGDAFFRGLNLAIQQLFKRRHWLAEVGYRHTTR